MIADGELMQMKQFAKKGTIGIIYFFAKKAKVSIAIFIAICVVKSCEQVAWPLILKFFINALQSNTGSQSSIIAAATPYLITGLILWVTIDLIDRGIFLFRAYVLKPTIQGNAVDYLTQYIIKKPYHFFITKSSDLIVNRINQVAGALFEIFDTTIRDLITAVFSIAMIIVSFFLINKQLGVIVLTHILIYAAIVSFFFKKSVIVAQLEAKSKNTMLNKILDSVFNIESVKNFNKTNNEIKRISSFKKRYVLNMSISNAYPEKVNFLLSFTGILILGLWFYYTEIHLYVAGKITIADVSFNFAAITNLMFLLSRFAEDFTQTIMELGACKDGINFLLSDELKLEFTTKINEEKRNFDIKFTNLTFQYNDDLIPILYNFNLHIPFGEKIGIVGKSGSGKSTIIALLLQHFKPTSGSISIGDIDCSMAPADEIRKYISIIPQDSTLFDRTIAENIGYGKQNATLEEIIEAAKKANAHDFISTLEHGYYTTVQEKGSNLSGGQRQRIIIARAILKDAPILILDEATAALDAKTESEIMHTIESFAANKTVIAIAHRTNTLVNMNRVINLS
jgi:ATP-binding cassette subfamily B protein